MSYYDTQPQWKNENGDLFLSFPANNWMPKENTKTSKRTSGKHKRPPIHIKKSNQVVKTLNGILQAQINGVFKVPEDM